MRAVLGHTLRASLRTLLLLAVAVVALATVAGFYGAANVWLDYAAHFRPHLAGAAAAGMLATAVLLAGWRRLTLTALLAGCAIVNASVMVAEADYRAGVAEEYVPLALRIAAVNVYFFNREPQRIEAWLRQEQPDVVVLTEVDRSWRPRIARLADLYPYQAVGQTAFTVMIARRPWESLEVAAGPRRGQGILVARFDMAGTKLTVIGAHPASPIHPRYARRRNAELEIVARLASDAPGPVVAMGDFNATPWSAPMRRLVRGSPLRYADLMATTWPTFLPGWLGIKIDHIMVGKGCAVAGYKVGPDVGSDHRPVAATIRCAHALSRAREREGPIARSAMGG
ncbi:endonuclease/exonuclease/phosphatase family protein [Vineibacter terrae]|nr:endonuclease/exonuclease/phosphatase family protein [Vineibacter terrae]